MKQTAKERRIKERRRPPYLSDQNYRLLIENVSDYAIFMMDKKGLITSWDQGAYKLFGYKREEIVGKHFSVLFSKEDIKKKIPQNDMLSAVLEGRHLDERQYVKKNNTKFWSSGVLTSSRDKKGIHQGFSKIMRDVTEQTDLHKTAVHNSMHDFLTGLPNRSFFEENLLECISRTKKGEILGVFYMDFDKFKEVNDTLGHETGDLVLIAIADRLGHNIRKSDLAARFGGDEFVILAKGFKNKAMVEKFARKIVKTFVNPIGIKNKTIKTSVSIGIALYPSHGTKPSSLLRYSDLALYEAKKSGGNQYKFYGDKIASKTRKKIRK